jgi:hypothetical protein
MKSPLASTAGGRASRLRSWLGGDCAKRDSDCHVIAIGPFAVEPNN